MHGSILVTGAQYFSNRLVGCLFTCQIHLSGIGFKGFPNRISAEISELGKCALNKYILSSGSHLDNSSINMLAAGMGLLVIALTIFPVVVRICAFRSCKGRVWPATCYSRGTCPSLPAQMQF